MKLEQADMHGGVSEGDLLKVQFSGKHPFVAKVVETWPETGEARVVYETRMNGSAHPKSGQWRIVDHLDVLGIVRKVC